MNTPLTIMAVKSWEKHATPIKTRRAPFSKVFFFRRTLLYPIRLFTIKLRE